MPPSDKQLKMDAFLQEFFFKDDDEDNSRFVTKWIVMVETQSIEGHRRVSMHKSDMPPWDALGMASWAVEVFKGE